jgi:hypothetical protein
VESEQWLVVSGQKVYKPDVGETGTSMSGTDFDISHPPIVEAVFDIDCDMSPAFDLAVLEKTTHEAFGDQYPKFRPQFLEEHKIEQKADQPRIC